jgi:hypothetical protein
MFIFNLNVVPQRIFLKMGLISVRFTPGFPPGAGFPREECRRKMVHGEENWGILNFRGILRKAMGSRVVT